MTITLTPSVPLNGAVAVPTATTISFNVSTNQQVRKNSLITSVGPTLALNSQTFVADGTINNTSGTGLSISGGGLLTIATATFVAGDVGKSVRISGALNGANNSVFPITAFNSPTQVQLGVGPFVAETSGFTWHLQGSQIFTSSGAHTFVAGDVGKILQLLNSSVPGNNVEGTITTFLNSNQVRTTVSYTGGGSAEPNLSWVLAGFENSYTGSVVTDGGNGFNVTLVPPTALLGSTLYSIGVTATTVGAASASSPFLDGAFTNALVGFSDAGSYTFTAQDVGRSIYILNAATSANNGLAQITVFHTATSVDTAKTFVAPSQGGRSWYIPPATASAAYSFTTGARPFLASANTVVGDPFGRNIRLKFSLPMLNNAALSLSGNYVISSSGSPLPFVPAISSVTPEAVGSPTYVDIRLVSPMTNNGAYSIDVDPSGIFAASGNRLQDPPGDHLDFVGFGPVTDFSVYKDTLVNTPRIEGPLFLSFAPTDATLVYVSGLGGFKWSANIAGPSGNGLTVWLKDPGANSQPLIVELTGSSTLVLLATDPTGTITSRIEDVVLAMTTAGLPLSTVSSGDATALVVPMVGPEALSGGATLDPTATYNILANTTDPLDGSLDPDVVALDLGPSSAGVVLLSDFINNGDGSGSFKATFSTAVHSYHLSIVVVDNVDNVSAESNILAVNVLADTLPGLDLVIQPQRAVSSDVCDRLIADIPETLFILKDGFVVPYTFDPFPFALSVVDIGTPVFITVTRESTSGKSVSNVTSFMPRSLREVVPLQLGKGRNYIFATDGTRTTQIVVSATTYASILCAIATEIFDFSRVDLDSIDLAIHNPLSTSLANPYLELFELLPSVGPQQLLAAKLAIRAYVTDHGNQESVEELATAISIQTPVIKPTTNNRVDFEPATTPLFNTPEDFGGSDIHLWFHNLCVSRWLGFIKFLDNFPDDFRLLSVDDTAVEFLDDNDVEQEAEFDFLDPDCSTLDVGNFCLDQITITTTSAMVLRMLVCAASYPMDMCFSGANPLGSGKVVLDVGLTWDTGTLFDQAYLDPGNDGWVGYCLLPHWDSPPDLDAVLPQYGDEHLGQTVGIGNHIFGLGTHFLDYVLVGDHVYFENENILYKVLTVDSPTQLTLTGSISSSPFPAQSGSLGALTVGGPGQPILSGLTGPLVAGSAITLFNNPTPLNNGTFFILDVVSPTSVHIEAPMAIAPDTNLNWVVHPANLRRLSGTSWDSMGPQPADAYLGKAYIPTPLDPVPGSSFPVTSDRCGNGLSITTGGVLSVAAPVFAAGDLGHSIKITGSGSGNNGIFQITSVDSPSQVHLGTGPFFNETASFTWDLLLSGSTTWDTDLILGETVYFADQPGILYTVAAPPADGQHIVVQSPVTIPPTQPHGRVVPGSPSLTLAKTLVPACVFPEGYVVTPATITSADVVLNEKGTSSESFTFTRVGGTSVSVGGTITVTSAIFLATDVGNSFAISAALNPANDKVSVILTYISPTQVTISNGPYIAEGPGTFTWSMIVT